MEGSIVPVAGEPVWFNAPTFSEEVLNFSFRKIGEIPDETKRSLNRLPEEFRHAVKAVGKAVFTLQASIHKELRNLFLEHINMFNGVIQWLGGDAITEFMRQGNLRHDVFNSFFSALAFIGELSLFLKETAFPAPRDLHHLPFCRIYDYSLKGELLAEGGFEKLVEAANTRYISSGLYGEVKQTFKIDNCYPNEIIINNLSDAAHFSVDLVRGLNPGNGVAPRNIHLGLSILRELYLEHGVVPLNPPGN